MEDIDQVPITKVAAGDWSKSDHIPEDVYEVIISNIRKVNGTNFKTKEPETQLEFEFKVTDDTAKDAKLYRIVTPKIGKGDNPSNLWKIISCTLGPQTDTEQEFHVSSLKGLKLRVTVKEAEGKNGKYSRVEDFMKLKK